MHNYGFRNAAFKLVFLVTAGLVGAAGSADRLPLPKSADGSTTPIAWRTDYHDGLDEAADRAQMALIWFYDPVNPTANESFERDVVSQEPIATQINDRFVPIRLPV